MALCILTYDEQNMDTAVGTSLDPKVASTLDAIFDGDSPRKRPRAEEKNPTHASLERAADAVRRDTGLEGIDKADFVNLYAYRCGLSKEEKSMLSQLDVPFILEGLREMDEVYLYYITASEILLTAFLYLGSLYGARLCKCSVRRDRP